MEIVDRRVMLSEIGQTVGPAPVSRFVANVRRNGVVIPILLREVVGDDGAVAYRIVDGNRRVAAAREAGFQDVPARVMIGVSSEEAARLVLTANNFRSANEITEYWAIKHLQRSGAGRTEIAEDAGIDPRYLRIRDRWGAFDRRLFAGYAAGKIHSSIANKLVKMTPADQTYFGDMFERKGYVASVDLQSRAPQRKAASATAPSPDADAEASMRTSQAVDGEGQPVTLAATGAIAGLLPAELRQAVEEVARMAVLAGVALPDLTRAVTVAYRQAAPAMEESGERIRG